MIIPAASNINFYETSSDIGRVEPYAVIPVQEFGFILKRFVSWAVFIPAHPEVAESFGESSTVHIRLATDLRHVIKNATQLGTYPNVVLPSHKFTTVMTVSRISQRLEQEIHEVLEIWEY